MMENTRRTSPVDRARRSRAITALTAALLMTVTAIALPAAAAPESPEKTAADATASAEVISESQRIRGELGFDDSLKAVSKVLDSKGLALATPEAELLAAVNQWGFIGTEAEDREVQRRDSLVMQVERDLPELSAAKGFAGHFLDNENGGTFVIQFQRGTTPTSFTSTLSASARSVGGAAADIEIREVAFSSAQLTDAMRTVWEKAQAGKLSAQISSIGEDPKTNGLTIAVTDAAALKRVSVLAEGIGVPTSFTIAQGADLSCGSRISCDSPRRGGVGITRSGGSCTTGWIVVRSGVRGAITAGHCWYGTNSGNVLSSSSAVYGSLTSTNALTNATHADMRWIAIPSGAQPWIYANNSAKQNVVKGSSLGTVGATACQFGRNSATPRCGTMTSTNTSHTSDAGFVVYGQSRATFPGLPGDSGGSVATSATGVTARGTVSNGGSSGVNYSWIGYTSQYNLGTLLLG